MKVRRKTMFTFQKSFGTFRNLLEHFGTFWNIFRTFWNIFRTFWNIFRTFWNIFRTFWNIFQNISEPFGIFQNISEMKKIPAKIMMIQGFCCVFSRQSSKIQTCKSCKKQFSIKVGNIAEKLAMDCKKVFHAFNCAKMQRIPAKRQLVFGMARGGNRRNSEESKKHLRKYLGEFHADITQGIAGL